MSIYLYTVPEHYLNSLSMKKGLLFLLAVFTTTIIYSQVTVSGKIVDSSNGDPIIGATILEVGTPNGTVSDIDGNYRLTIDENGQLAISYLGYETLTVNVGSRTQIAIELQPSAQQLESVIVTAFGIEREKKAAGFAFSEVGGDELNEAREVNVASQLVGKVAGLDIVKPSNGPSGATRITIRGLAQFQGENRPLMVIDGIPADNSNVATAGLYGGRDSGDGFSSLNPDDIENITVLKGPAAAALYGSRAGNGVILVTTKKGSGRKGIGVEYTTNFTTEEVTPTPQLPARIWSGSQRSKTDQSTGSF